MTDNVVKSMSLTGIISEELCDLQRSIYTTTTIDVLIVRATQVMRIKLGFKFWSLGHACYGMSVGPMKIVKVVWMEILSEFSECKTEKWRDFC